MRVLMAPDYRQYNPYQRLLAGALAAHGVTAVFPQGYRRVFPLWRAILDATPRIDVIHLHWQEAYIRSSTGLGTLTYALKLLVDLSLLKASGRRLVWTVHNDIPHDTKYPRLHAALQRGLAVLADVVIFHSRSAAAQLRGRLRVSEEKIRVIPHGHYRDYYGPPVPRGDARASLNLPSEGLVYLHFGILRPYKGIEELLEAWSAVAAHMSGAHLVIAGQPLDEGFAKTLTIQAAACPRTTLRLGYVPENEIPAYFSAADFAVLPFRRSLTSGSLMLAASYQMPVITPLLPFSAEFAAPEFLYAPDEKGALEAALLASAQSAADRGGRSDSAGMARLDWREIGAATADCYLPSGTRRTSTTALMNADEGSR